MAGPAAGTGPPRLRKRYVVPGNPPLVYVSITGTTGKEETIMRIIMALALGLVLAGAARTPVAAQSPPASYGAPITLEDARRLVDATIADAQRRNLLMAVAVVDWAGNLAAFARIDSTQTASIGIALEKARTAAAYRRPSKAFEDALVGGRMAILSLPGALPIEGGVLVLRDGRIVGPIGVSGGTAQEDGQVAAAGLAALR